MRKIIMLNQISIDGYFAGPNGEIDWFVHTPEIGNVTHSMMEANTVIFGRVTYEMFSNYWPNIADDETASDSMRKTSQELNAMTKFVASSSLQDVNWVNSKLISKDFINVVKKIKTGEGKDIAIFGSGSIVRQLSNAGLIDDYIIQVSPIVLGKGKGLFEDANQIPLELLDSRIVSGCTINHYKPR